MASGTSALQWMRDLRAALASAAAVSLIAFIFAVAAPPVAFFLAAMIPRVYVSLVAWLTPPYLYLVVNGIIITIAASSRFQKLPFESDNRAPPPPPPEPASPIVVTAQTPVRKLCAVEYKAKLSDDVVSGRAMYSKVRVEPGEETPARADQKVADKDEEEDDQEEDFVISRSNWCPRRLRDSSSTEISQEKPVKDVSLTEKPLVSTRIGHRKPIKPSPEGKEALRRVARPRRHETLESTWRAITDGRAVPLSRHLKRSETWDVSVDSEEEPAAVGAPARRSTWRNSETFNDRSTVASPSSSPASSGGKGRREASLGQDELNRRVEAFIKKFNEEMRLQRQESFKQYMNIVNRGSHY